MHVNHFPTIFTYSQKLACGDGFTLVGTTENELYFWGSKNGQRSALAEEGPMLKCDNSMNSTSSRRGTKKTYREVEQCNPDVVPLPSLILRLDSSESKRKIHLSNIALSGYCAYVVVDTYEGPSYSAAHSIAPPTGSVQSSTEDSEEVNTWLKKELEQAEVIPLSVAKVSLFFIARFRLSTLPPIASAKELDFKFKKKKNFLRMIFKWKRGARLSSSRQILYYVTINI
ncbi:unnamed protein product [Strongylus vulgaris]|uniref:Uncharacterized protein n=1 Tax=Strongylus vulgaris TaxID=40348 RepID=A0A3P7ILE5_STRVU|nr:unnamed protein product [Strongylus vulgaris]